MIKKIFKSFLNFFLFSALVHNCVLIFSTIKESNIKHLNYFKIIGLEVFWPRITDGKISDLVSAGVMILIVVSFLLISLRKKIIA
ncbi:MAG: hypothetical protein KIH89_004080 [Candidatus Shapirobacteria bacterium]|nr:hypothetical protein [Candidatus Shapirobacteria bacterium]